ncbi:PTS system mannose/fructose/N-acetylgalactosamine-transporter subunit IIB [Lactiplantibacillus pentosus]|jgi:PTS system mannose-specific IIB component|uniref:PTS system mannose/fructose/N-acetylgalactosamine-transporter subunit IIB n=1 Tax=Lactiplantibacillus pentosus TaxID=1589 RepID=UPI000B53E12B|nr:PTS sugar transporter subunit IIB [Lactiplantibacillus pentosus]ASG79896.1 PTS mannose/fructose/sorbose transporter subunit IIB [Lactiplantibacillus pentosus]MCS8604518.1 PTS mannose/fructose/sorbose transporter subunit IIB [Lactiplantibacillus pentosus]
MQGFVNIRIDDRLIHGQVATRWATGLRVNRIMVIDNDVANDDVQKSVLRMAAPSGISTSIITEEKAITNIKAGKYDKQRVLLVVRRPRVLLNLVEAGLDIQKINIGNMSNREETVQVKKSVSLTSEERQDIEALIAKGVKVTAQMVPDDAEVDFAKFLK